MRMKTVLFGKPQDKIKGRKSAMKEKKRVCIAGLGHIGKAHLEALRRLGQTEVVGISCRKNARQRAEELFGSKWLLRLAGNDRYFKAGRGACVYPQ